MTLILDIARRFLGEDGMPRLRQANRAVRMWWHKHFKYRLKSVGRGVTIGRGTYIRPHCLEIGDYTFIGENCWLSAGDIRIGRFVMLASEVSIVGGDHGIAIAAVPSIRTGRSERRPVTIEDDVWIGRGATIMHGVHIGEGAVVAARALVTKDVPPYTIVGSPPARVIGQRFATEADIARHRRMLAVLRRHGSDYFPGWEALDEHGDLPSTSATADQPLAREAEGLESQSH
jgi:serine acetyltransferase